MKKDSLTHFFRCIDEKEVIRSYGFADIKKFTSLSQLFEEIDFFLEEDSQITEDLSVEKAVQFWDEIRFLKSYIKSI